MLTSGWSDQHTEDRQWRIPLIISLYDSDIVIDQGFRLCWDWFRERGCNLHCHLMLYHWVALGVFWELSKVLFFKKEEYRWANSTAALNQIFKYAWKGCFRSVDGWQQGDATGWQKLSLRAFMKLNKNLLSVLYVSLWFICKCYNSLILQRYA
jgi:hypothetical protein